MENPRPGVVNSGCLQHLCSCWWLRPGAPPPPRSDTLLHFRSRVLRLTKNDVSLPFPPSHWVEYLIARFLQVLQISGVGPVTLPSIFNIVAARGIQKKIARRGGLVIFPLISLPSTLIGELNSTTLVILAALFAS